MSSLARWSLTSKATHWPVLSVDGWSRLPVYGSPVVFACDYMAQAKRVTDSKGVEFTSSQVIYCERPEIKPGDMVAIGEHSGTPADAQAWMVKAVKVYADTFEGLAEDVEVIT